MALFASLTPFLPGLNAFRNADLRETMQTVLNLSPDRFSASRMSYDLRRLRLKGLIARVEGRHRYFLTTYGRRVVPLITKLDHRILGVACIAPHTQAPLPTRLAQAFKQLDAELDRLVAQAGLAPAKT